MFQRTQTGTGHHTIPEREQVDLSVALCPPHAFEQGWGLAPGEDIHADTVPVMFCSACGSIRWMRIPDEE